MAAKPNNASAGCDPIADLLFSPRAALIWDHSASAIAWMNAAARSRFEATPGELQTKLARRLKQCFGTANKKGKTCGTFKLKSGSVPAVSCSFEVLELAGGHEGLIVSETATGQDLTNVFHLPAAAKNLRQDCTQHGSAKKKKKKKKKKKPAARASANGAAAPRRRQTPAKPAAPACSLIA